MNKSPDNKSKNVVIIGDGAWGNALKTVIASHCPGVAMWDRKFDLSNADVIVLAVPTIAIRDVLSRANLKPGCIIINTSKGVEQNSHLLPFQIVNEMMGDAEYFTLIGPSFASEVVEKIPTIVNIGYRNPKHADYVKSLFQTSTFHVRMTIDVEVIELFAAFKNVYAIAAGIAHGIGLKANTQAKLTVLALEELYSMMRTLNLTISSESLAGTVGDLVLTTYSEESRNYRFGKALVTLSTEDALKLIASTVEGYNTASSIHFLAQKYSVHLPLAQIVYDIIIQNDPKSTKAQFSQFLEEV